MLAHCPDRAFHRAIEGNHYNFKRNAGPVSTSCHHLQGFWQAQAHRLAQSFGTIDGIDRIPGVKLVLR